MQQCFVFAREARVTRALERLAVHLDAQQRTVTAGRARNERYRGARVTTVKEPETFGLATHDFTMNNPEGWCHLFGRKHRFREVEAKPHLVGAHLDERERGATCARMWERALQPFIERFATSGEEAWQEIVGKFDAYSIREFLEESGWSEAAIELFGLLMNQESLMNTSFLELLREEVGHFYTDMVRIDEGMDHLPRGFLPQLQSRIHFGARMVALDQSERDVCVHYQTAAGRTRAHADYAIITVPFSVLRHVEMMKPLSLPKRKSTNTAAMSAFSRSKRSASAEVSVCRIFENPKP